MRTPKYEIDDVVEFDVDNGRNVLASTIERIHISRDGVSYRMETGALVNEDEINKSILTAAMKAKRLKQVEVHIEELNNADITWTAEWDHDTSDYIIVGRLK